MTDLNPAEIKPRLKALGLFGLIACCDQIIDKPWLRDVLAIEERERQKRGFERRARDAHVGAAKPMADFDWAWLKKIDREAIEELFSLSFVKTGHNTVLVGPNGVGKTMILKNIALQALARGHTVRFTTASDMLAELAAQDSSSILARRLRRYTLPHLLCIDEVGYLSYNSRYADLLFEVVTRRYDAGKPIVLSTNKAILRMGRGLSARGLRRHAGRSPHSSCRSHRHRRRQLSLQGGRRAHRRPLHPPQQENRVLMPTVTGELHRSQARFSPVNFTEYPRFLMPANKYHDTLLILSAPSCVRLETGAPPPFTSTTDTMFFLSYSSDTSVNDWSWLDDDSGTDYLSQAYLRCDSGSGQRRVRVRTTGYDESINSQRVNIHISVVPLSECPTSGNVAFL